MSLIRRTRRRAAASIVLAAALVATAACSKDSGSNNDTVKLGLLVPLSGVYKSIGEDMKRGFELYVEQHNNKFGGHKIEVVVADEGEAPGVSLSAATKLVKQDKVAAVVGVSSGAAVAAITPMLADNRVPLIGSGGRPNLQNIDRVWNTSWMSDETGAAIAKYVKDTVNGPVGIIGPDYQGGQDQIRGFTDTFVKAGGQVANSGGKPTFTPWPGTTNFLPYLSQIAQSGAKAVYTFYAGSAAVDFVKQYKQSDAKDIPLYAAGFLTEGATLAAEGDAARDIYSVLNYAPGLDNPANRNFVSAYNAKHKTQPNLYAMCSFDAGSVLDRAITAIDGKVTSEAINNAIRGLGQIDSPRGAWQFGANHSPVQKWYLRQVRPDGQVLSNVVVQELATLGS
ncbi:ABC transporter substrate-binding protein [Yinghuangia seranimata]|uniref:ABC transporter substrate-binding protein n=1 Tax=Yinghuangia seranimata TaxID=408067 RepID=UPI00248C2E3A|nr:ABC transporter substrate-binding protein [Yinghuangia seranimata]MDI2129914.1 ABC transporter substrate-binding protein [Yinghuangia seranimata]